jgi:hypothetical protein
MLREVVAWASVYGDSRLARCKQSVNKGLQAGSVLAAHKVPGVWALHVQPAAGTGDTPLPLVSKLINQSGSSSACLNAPFASSSATYFWNSVIL